MVTGKRDFTGTQGVNKRVLPSYLFKLSYLPTNVVLISFAISVRNLLDTPVT